MEQKKYSTVYITNTEKDHALQIIKKLTGGESLTDFIRYMIIKNKNIIKK